MAKTQIKYSSARDARRRIRRDAKTCLGLLCAMVLVTAALPSAAPAAGESATGDGARIPVAMAAPADLAVASATHADSGEQASVDTSDGFDEAPAPGEPQAPLQPQGNAEKVGPEFLLGVGDGFESDLSPPVAAGALAAESRSGGADPAGFVWTGVRNSDASGKGVTITGYRFNGSTTGVVDAGTVHVPEFFEPNQSAATPSPGPVTRIQGGLNAFQNIRCTIDFSSASHITQIAANSFQNAGLSGPLDLSGLTALKTINQYTFSGCANVTSLTLPPNIEEIKAFAFQKMSGLSSATLILPASLRTLEQYSGSGHQFAQESAAAGRGIRFLQIEQGSPLEKIPSSAFRNNCIEAVTTVTRNGAGAVVSETEGFPASIRAFNGSSFKGNKISNLVINAPSIAVGANAFENNFIANSDVFSKTFSRQLGVSALGPYAFAGNLFSGTVDLSKVVAAIPPVGLIAHCPNVTGLLLSTSWTIIPESMFEGLTGLTSVAFKEAGSSSLRIIGAKAFKGCTSLGVLDLKNSPLNDESSTKIAVGASAFQGCTSLERVVLSDRAQAITSRVITVGNDAFQGCTSLKNLVLPPDHASPELYSTSYKINQRAFKDTALGEGDIPLLLGGTLPLHRYTITSIGTSAFENAKLSGVTLRGGLRTIGSRAFTNNHMLLPPAMPDSVTTIASDAFESQSPYGSMFFRQASPGDGVVFLLDALESVYGVPKASLSSTALYSGTAPSALPTNSLPDDPQFGVTKEVALTLRFGYTVSVKDAAGTDHGSMTAVFLNESRQGLTATFRVYESVSSDGRGQGAYEDVVQYLPADPSGTKLAALPSETYLGRGGFGYDGLQPGYRAPGGAYISLTGQGWLYGNGAASGLHPIDPAAMVPAAGGYWDKRSFYAARAVNSYAASFDDGWERMVALDARLGKPDPDDPSRIVRNDLYVKGSMSSLEGLDYGEPAALPENGFRMGAYDFDGWATSPDLTVGERVVGSNFFPPGSSISKPDPAPAHEGEVMLYAQWGPAKEYDAATGFIVPSKVEMKTEDGYPQADVEVSMVATSTAPGAQEPGASWPVGSTFDFSIPWTATSADGASGRWILESGSGSKKPFRILGTGGALYVPGVADASGHVAPLYTFSYNDAATTQLTTASFTLKADEPWTSFEEGELYEAVLTYWFIKKVSI